MLPSYFLSIIKKLILMSINFLNVFMRKNIDFKIDFILSFLRWRRFGSRAFKIFKNIKNNLITQNYSLTKFSF